MSNIMDPTLLAAFAAAGAKVQADVQALSATAAAVVPLQDAVTKATSDLTAAQTTVATDKATLQTDFAEYVKAGVALGLTLP